MINFLWYALGLLSGVILTIFVFVVWALSATNTKTLDKTENEWYNNIVENGSTLIAKQFNRARIAHHKDKKRGCL